MQSLIRLIFISPANRFLARVYRNHPIQLSILPSVCTYVYPSVCQFVHMSISPSVSLYICPSVRLSVFSYVRPSVSLYICPSIRLSVCTYVPPSVCQFVHICPSVRLSVCTYVSSADSSLTDERMHLLMKLYTVVIQDLRRYILFQER